LLHHRSTTTVTPGTLLASEADVAWSWVSHRHGLEESQAPPLLLRMTTPPLLLHAVMGRRDPGSGEPFLLCATTRQGTAPPLALEGDTPRHAPLLQSLGKACAARLVGPAQSGRVRRQRDQRLRKGSWWILKEDGTMENREGNDGNQRLMVDAVWKCNTCWRLVLCRVHHIYCRIHTNVLL
jgi:hypothetical protein